MYSRTPLFGTSVNWDKTALPDVSQISEVDCILKGYNEVGESFLSQIVTGDKM